MTKEQGTDLLYQMMAEMRTYDDGIVMGRGDPDFDTPPHIIMAAERAMQAHGTEYVPPEGIRPLRRAIARRVHEVNGIEVDPETEVLVTNGGQEAVFLMVAATLHAGDEVVAAEPNYNSYNDALEFVGARRVGVPTYARDDFRVDPEALRAAITDRTKALLLVSPNNPTAGVTSPEDVQAYVDIARDHDLLILADDIYDLFVYEPYLHCSPASLPGGKERTLTMNAVSKAYAMTGWRLGWIVGPADLMAEVRKVKEAVTGGTSVISQYAAVSALTETQAPTAQMKAAYEKRRQIVLDGLDEMGLGYGVPQGGQFIFADISNLGVDSATAALRILREGHVLVYPGSAFANRTHSLRITFLQPEEILREGMERMKKVVAAIAADR